RLGRVDGWTRARAWQIAANVSRMSSSRPIEAQSFVEPSEISLEGLLKHAWLDRDLSWLEFNRRGLAEALDERDRLVERVKFLAIFSSNLDEFFMKRMALIRPEPDDASLAAQERRDLLVRKRDMIVEMLLEQARCYNDVIRPQLAERGIQL